MRRQELLLVYPAAGLSIGVLVVGAAAATAVYAKNRTDHHNAGVQRGEIWVPPDPNLSIVPVGSFDPLDARRLAELGYRSDELPVFLWACSSVVRAGDS